MENKEHCTADDITVHSIPLQGHSQGTHYSTYIANLVIRKRTLVNKSILNLIIVKYQYAVKSKVKNLTRQEITKGKEIKASSR